MKAFLVVGTLFPFPRLVSEIDDWAGSRNDVEVTGQIGETKYSPKHIKAYSMLKASEFNRIFDESDLIITHAGMGIILKSLVVNKPIIVMPRRLELNEHTTDHQMATAKALESMDYVDVAWDNDQLIQYLKEPEKIRSKRKIEAYASGSLISSLKEFIKKA